MIGAIRRTIDRLRGAGEHAVTLPPMDGALQPNQAIEAATMLMDVARPDNLVAAGGEILLTSGAALLSLSQGRPPVHRFEAPVSALAASAAKTIAAGLADGRIVIRGGAYDGTTIDRIGDRTALCPTALLFEDESTLLVCLGSRRNGPGKWRHDLMQREASGSVWRVPIGGQARKLADGLAWPQGLLAAPDGALVVAEAWRSRLLRIRADGTISTLYSDIPGYPARLSPRANGGAWLAAFAPRSQLIEFVLRERDYCDEMMRTVPEQLWIAPSLTSPRSFLEPLQGGALKQLGILKPWAPTRSFGLIIALDPSFRPVQSFHSRADGTRHGITSCLEREGHLLLCSQGGDCVMALETGKVE